MTGTPSSLWFAFAFIGLAMNLPASAQAQAIRGELLAVDAVRARKALDNHLGAEKAAGYARVKSGCEFPPCTDVQKRFAVFESVIEAAPSVSRRRQLTCIGERGMPWTCTRHRVIVTFPGRSRDIELSETLSDTKALAALEFQDSECFAPQRDTLNAKR